jgi:hypothetical protein
VVITVKLGLSQDYDCDFIVMNGMSEKRGRSRTPPFLGILEKLLFGVASGLTEAGSHIGFTSMVSRRTLGYSPGPRCYGGTGPGRCHRVLLNTNALGVA